MRIIATGGTFDKYYDELRGELTFKDSHLPAILKQARITAPIVLEINQLIDSLHMQEVNRQHILASCRAAPETQIVVIHGTDTMALTARVLGEAQLAKTIVLTGAMVPYAVQGSDALFNLGFACAAAQLLSPGVYIAMNGQVFAWDKVRKNTQLGIFERISTEQID
ncbi:MAG: asparaginase [Chloroflexota bacterium]|jgi:L-asparaginase|nr:asparaginase [Caldilinea sp.]GIK75138.1 MAG: asparaginase [Chloroflexota bacterium]